MSAPPSDVRERLRTWLVSGLPLAPADAEDAQAIAAGAQEQRLTALLHTAVSAAAESGSSPWPRAVLDAMAAEHRRLLVRGVGQLDLMARAAAVLAGRGLRALPLKGAAVAESLYLSVAERPMGDVDALALDDWDASVRALEEAGFACAERADHASSFVDPMTRGLLELHRSVTSCPGVYPLDADGLWARAEPAAGQVARVPSPEDLLVQLSEHALFQHGGVLSLGQWLDFRRLLERWPVDRARLAEAIGEPHVSLCVQLAAAATAAIVGAPPLEIARESPLPRSLRRWLDEVRGNPASALSPASPSLGRMRWHLARGRRWELLKGTLEPPPDPRRQETSWASAAAVVRRAALVAWRWGVTVLR